MTDQTLDDQVRPIVAAMRAAMRRDAHAYPEAKFLADLSGYIKDLEALLPAPPRPTLADMTQEERAQHVTGQVDVNTPTFAGRGILVGFDTLSRVTLKNAHAMILTRDWRSIVVSPKDVTPRPDLPPLEWPGEKKPDPAPALPGGWKLADHEKRGRVIVTTDTPNTAGEVCFVLPATDPLGYDWLFCTPDELTYIDIGRKADQ